MTLSTETRTLPTLMTETKTRPLLTRKARACPLLVIETRERDTHVHPRERRNTRTRDKTKTRCQQNLLTRRKGLLRANCFPSASKPSVDAPNGRGFSFCPVCSSRLPAVLVHAANACSLAITLIVLSKNSVVLRSRAD